MANTNRVSLKIRYTDGKSERFSFLRDDDDVNPIGRFQQVSGAQSLILELKDRMLAIPFHTIRNIEISPKPTKFAPQVIRDVRRED